MNSIWLMKLGKKHIEEETMNRDECRGVPGLQCFSNQAYNCSIWENISINRWTINLVLESLCLSNSNCYSIVMLVFHLKSSVSLWNFPWPPFRNNNNGSNPDHLITCYFVHSTAAIRNVWIFETDCIKLQWSLNYKWRKIQICIYTAA